MPATPDDAANTVTDERLMLDFTRGSTDAFTELFSRYKQPIFGFFRRRLANPDHADELTQETFFAVLRSASTYQPTALFRTFLYAIALRILQSHRRKTAFRNLFLGVPATDREPAAPPTSTDFLLRDAIQRLPRHDREILMLREFEELSYAEIAALLHLPLNTVRTRLFRARTALRDLLSAPMPTPTPALTPHEERA